MSAAASLACPVPAGAPTEPTGYFQKSLPGNLILGSFFALTLPLAAFIWCNNSQLLLWCYLWLFGMTHFVLTFTIYLNRANLAHFGSSSRNRLVYFALPVAIFIGFDLIHVLHVREVWPLLALYFFATVRLLDFNHFGRQAFGVLQMFKTARNQRYPKHLKDLENWCLKAGTVLMLITFLAGGISPLLQAGGPLTIASCGWTLAGPMAPLPALQIAATMAALCFFGLLAAAIVGHCRARVGAGVDKPLAYLLFQAMGVLLATIAFPLYAAALAIHYVEYQVLMYPRCFHCDLDETSRVDRLFAHLRSSPIVFYMAVLAAAGLATAFCFTGMGLTGMTTMDLSEPSAYLVVIALFDGLFVFHYVVEAYIWRFSEPYYRKNLGGLYFRFPARAVAPSGAP
jgi:hypothetical protein